MERFKIKRYIARGLSTRAIARRCSCSQSNVRYWMKKYNLYSLRELKNRGGDPVHKIVHHCTKCGETRKEKFYTHQLRYCKKCWNSYKSVRGNLGHKYAIKILGGKCVVCGFSAYSSALEIHHKNPKMKHPSFSQLRYWSMIRIEKEVSKKCVCLCSNCHRGVHSGDIVLSKAQCRV